MDINCSRGAGNMEQWYTLYTKSKSEYQVVAALQERGFQTYLPETVSVKGRQKGKNIAFFPRYLFVKVDFEAVGLSQVQWTPGLRRIVSFDSRPVSVPNEVIDLIGRKLDEIKTTGGWPARAFKPGDPVRITNGPFRDMPAIFDGPTTPTERVQVLLKILGHVNRVQMAVDDLEKASSEAEIPKPKRPRRTRGQGRRINSSINGVMRSA